MGAKPSEAKALLVFGMFNESRKFAHFSKIWKRKKIDICIIFTKKIMSGYKTGKRAEHNVGPGLKPPLAVYALQWCWWRQLAACGVTSWRLLLLLAAMSVRAGTVRVSRLNSRICSSSQTSVRIPPATSEERPWLPLKKHCCALKMFSIE